VHGAHNNGQTFRLSSDGLRFVAAYVKRLGVSDAIRLSCLLRLTAIRTYTYIYTPGGENRIARDSVSRRDGICIEVIGFVVRARFELLNALVSSG